MKMLDRRFLNVSLSVLAVANEPAADPYVGAQYIVGPDPAGVFADAAPNSIARYNGSAWVFYAPRAGRLEVINVATGELLRWDGSAWKRVISLGGSHSTAAAVIPTGQVLPENPAPGEKFLNTADGKIYTADDNGQWDNGTPLQQGVQYISSTDGKIYSADGEGTLVEDTPADGSVIFNKNNGSLYAYDADQAAFLKVSSAPAEHVTETHSLSAEEAAAKSFSLNHTVAQGQELNILCFVSGVAQAAGIDFSAAGSSISWNSLGLDDIGLEAGDIFIVHYVKG